MRIPGWVSETARAGYRRAPHWAQRRIVHWGRRVIERGQGSGGRPALSVVMPVYNVERYLQQAVDSVLSQSFRDLELILVDDGSTDSSGELCDRYAIGDSRIRVIHKQNAGLGAARNTGIAAARGDYVAFIDSDDYVVPGAYAAMMRSLHDSNSDLITGNVVRLDGKRYTQSWNQARSHLFHYTATTLSAHPELVFDTVCWNKVYRREFWDVHVAGFPTGKYFEDIVPVFKAFLNARSVDVLPRTVYVWRRRDEKNSITQRILEPRNVCDRFEMIDEVDDLIRRHSLTPAVAERFRLKILEGDLWIYVRELAGAPEETLERLRRAVDRYWTSAPETIAALVPVERRIAYTLIGAGRGPEVPDFLQWFWSEGRRSLSPRPGGGLMINVAGSPVALDGIPERYLRMPAGIRTLVGSTVARRVYHRLPHRVRRPAARAKRRVVKEIRSSRQVVVRLSARGPGGRLPAGEAAGRAGAHSAVGEIVIDTLECTPAGDIVVAFSDATDDPVEVGLAPGSGTPLRWIAAEQESGRCHVRVPTEYEDSAGIRRPLPSGPYRLCLRRTGKDGRTQALQVHVGTRIHLPHTALTEAAKVTLDSRGRGDVAVAIAAPVPDDVLAKPAQAELIARHGRTPRKLEHAVFFQVDVGFGSADSAAAIAEELRRRESSLTMYWGVEDLSVAVPAGAVPVVKLSEDWFAKLNASRYIVNNYGGAWGLTKDPGQRYLQTWHGTPLKFIGVSEARQNSAAPARLQKIAAEAAQWDAAVSPSPYFTRILASELLFAGTVLEVGYPRNDRLAKASGAERDALRAALGIGPATKALLYAPTYREGRRQGWKAPLYTGLDLRFLLDQLGPDWCVLLRGHNFNARDDLTDRSCDQVVDVTRHRDVNDLYIASDLLVTDYSSVMFDYAVSGKPMAFFVPDLEHYAAVRGMYLDLREIAPGPLCRDVSSLAEQVRDPVELARAHADRYADFRRQFSPWDDGNASARVVDAFFDPASGWSRE